MSAIDLSSYAGLCAMTLLTVNILLGLLLSTKYNPVLQWPRRRIKIFEIHNWTAYVALGLALLHPVLLLASSTAGFKVVDILYPLSSPGQRNYNILGALALYTVAFVVVTSYFRPRLGSRLWKKLHYAAYGAAAIFFTHGILTDPELKNKAIDPFDGEKVFIELCALLVIAGTVWRIRKRA
ncbi:MAG: Ferric reductase domain protein transrane component, N-terminal domain [Bryobacterales bacterium]|nr:Ferric reductase domain protein transrane component, N-terminal domain [Bryobacterales bacterium]